MTTAIVYSLPSCVQCSSAKRFLTRRGVEYESIKLDEDQEAYDRVSKYGYSGAPVIEILDGEGSVIDHFSGYQVTKLEHHFPKNEGK